MLEWQSILGAWLIAFLPNMAISVARQVSAGNESEREHQRYNRFALTWLLGFLPVAVLAAVKVLPIVGLIVTSLYLLAAVWWWRRAPRNDRLPAQSKGDTARSQPARLGLSLVFGSAAFLIVFIGANDAISGLLPGRMGPFDSQPYTPQEFFDDRWPHVLVALVGLLGAYLWVRQRQR